MQLLAHTQNVTVGVAVPAEPELTSVDKIPADYLERVRKVHESGGYGSLGY